MDSVESNKFKEGRNLEGDTIVRHEPDALSMSIMISNHTD